jgi:hypothetical protein
MSLIYVAKGDLPMSPAEQNVQSSGNFYSLISQTLRAAVLQEYGDLGTGQFKQKVIEAIKGSLPDFSDSPYLMISPQNTQINAWMDEAVARYSRWLDDGKPNI